MECSISLITISASEKGPRYNPAQAKDYTRTQESTVLNNSLWAPRYLKCYKFYRFKIHWCDSGNKNLTAVALDQKWSPFKSLRSSIAVRLLQVRILTSHLLSYRTLCPKDCRVLQWNGFSRFLACLMEADDLGGDLWKSNQQGHRLTQRGVHCGVSLIKPMPSAIERICPSTGFSQEWMRKHNPGSIWNQIRHDNRSRSEGVAIFGWTCWTILLCLFFFDLWVTK
jgi:hypothetical protein